MTDPKTLTDERCCEVPLIERLRAVPANGRLLIHGEYWSHSYPVGPLCHEAADEIERATREQTASTGGQALSEPTPLPKVEVICMSDGRGTFLNVTGVGRYEDGELQVLVAGGLDWAGVSDAAYAAAQQLEPADNARRQAFMGGAKWMASLLPRAAPVEQPASTGAQEREVDDLVSEWAQNVEIGRRLTSGAAPVEQAGSPLSLTDQFWLDHRQDIVSALAYRGLTIMSDRDSVWLTGDDAFGEQAGSPEAPFGWHRIESDSPESLQPMFVLGANPPPYPAKYRPLFEQAGSTPDETLREALVDLSRRYILTPVGKRPACCDGGNVPRSECCDGPCAQDRDEQLSRESWDRALATPTKPEMQSVHPAAVFGKEKT